ncbi:oxidoreductase domain protein [Coriobacterium glomerans PW2]|uniref:Oxidoreductase domain protein n=1 Tax=Coriobacterium glomerans (strain ATCC 49209 / DSM 20642 / JCM 10262 / PW2) TaxID=700015 RepID=F2NB50_CORGP|nr:Gfo/Idh/MocA family oxidoreductase [Coriobacterium glomerans]AEB07801.1 oxidoreductase domain protein [Coriobacterium glomerans PW2]
MKAKLSFGLIGFGFMGHSHADMITKLDYAELAAVCDINPDQLKFAPQGTATYADADDLLASEDVNTVIIAVPNHLHLDMVKKAAAAGKDIICEKPAAMDATQVQQMIDATRAANVRFTIHHQRRLDADLKMAKAAFESGELGDVYTVKSSLYGFNGNMHDWHVYPEYGGGMLYDWGVHLIDQILFMIPQRVIQVYADMRNVINKQVDDYFNILLRFEHGVAAQIELGTYFLCDQDGWFERHWFVAGNKACAYIDGFNPRGAVVTTSQLLENVPGKISMSFAGPTRSFGPPPEGRIISKPLPSAETSHRQFFDRYYGYVEGRNELFVKPDEILRLMRLIDTIRRSASEHRSLDFE